MPLSHTDGTAFTSGELVDFIVRAADWATSDTERLRERFGIDPPDGISAGESAFYNLVGRLSPYLLPEESRRVSQALDRLAKGEPF
jgi:hypothetical protein